MTSRSSHRVVYVATVTNLAIVICKYAASAVTGSSAMLAEAFHSTAAIFDFYSWRVSYKELLDRKDPDESTWEEIVGSKGPNGFHCLPRRESLAPQVKSTGIDPLARVRM